MSFPDNVCLAEPLEGTTRIRNSSDCTAEFRARFRPGIGEEITTDSQQLGPREETEFEFRMDRMPDNGIEIEQFIEIRRGDTWVEADSRADIVEPLFANLQFVSTPYPAFVQPDEPVSANITIQNAGDCETIAGLSGTRFTGKSVSLEPGETTDFTHRFNMPGNAVPVQLQVTDQERNITGDDFSTRIEPQQTVIIDQDAGEIRFIGGFDVRLNYNGVIQGRGLEAQNIDDEDRFVGGRKVASFSGQVSTSPDDSDVILFDNLDFLNVQFGSNIQWVFNGEILGEAESFQYSEYSPAIASSLFPVATEDPDITVRGGPLGRLGGVRDMLGVGAPLARSPIFTKTIKSR